MTARTYGMSATATFSKKDINQDAARFVTNSVAGIVAVIVADGIGSHYGADVASRVVAQSIAYDLGILQSDVDIDFDDLFKTAHLRLQAEVADLKETLRPGFDWDNAFGTTLICAVETSRALSIAYVGNGGIFHIRGNFNTFSAAQLLPWNSVNYLNPHSILADGKNALYKFISPRRSLEDTRPTVISISKDDTSFGDILLCCTDGIYSYDQVDVGRDEQHRVWISGEEAMERFYASLRSFFEDSHSAGALDATLDIYLQELDEAGLVTDDCTVGVLITPRVLLFQAELQERRKESIPA